MFVILFTELSLLHENYFTAYSTHFTRRLTHYTIAQRSALRCYQDDNKKHSFPQSPKRHEGWRTL